MGKLYSVHWLDPRNVPSVITSPSTTSDRAVEIGRYEQDRQGDGAEDPVASVRFRPGDDPAIEPPPDRGPERPPEARLQRFLECQEFLECDRVQMDRTGYSPGRSPISIGHALGDDPLFAIPGGLEKGHVGQ